MWKRHAALPADHGSWVFLLCPLVIGLAVGGSRTAASFYLVLAALAAFLIRQPITLAVKIRSGRRGRRDMRAALGWIAIYGLIGLASAGGLWVHGFGDLIFLAVPGSIAFAWYLWLLTRREERRQMGLELVGTAGLALGAPAAYWIGRGAVDARGWLLWALVWPALATLIVFAYLRLEQRGWTAVPPWPQRLRPGAPSLVLALTSVAAVFVLGLSGYAPPWLYLAHAAIATEVCLGVWQPAVGVRPRTIGLRLLSVSIAFTVLFLLTWR